MLNLIYVELLKLKKSKMILISILGVLSNPCLIFIEALETHFRHPENVLTLDSMFNNSLMYIMLLTNMIIYVAITAYLFSREYTEHTLKTLLPIPISRTKLLCVKFLALLLWIIMLTITAWLGVFLLSLTFHLMFHLEGFTLIITLKWLICFILGSMLMFITISPFAYIALKTKGFVIPVISASVIVMGSAALSNQDIGALYPYTATYFLVNGRIFNTGYSVIVAVILILLVSIIGYYLTFSHFIKEDIR